MDAFFQLGFYTELMKISQAAGMGSMTPTTPQNQAQVPSVMALGVAGQQAQAGAVPKAPMNPGTLMGTGANMSQFQDMAAGPTPRGPQRGSGAGMVS